MSLKEHLRFALYPLTLLLVLMCFIEDKITYIIILLLLTIYNLIRFKGLATLGFVILSILYYPKDIPIIDDVTINQQCIVKDVKSSSYLVNCENQFYYLVTEEVYVIGDVLKIKGEVSSLQNESSFFGFNQQAYQNSHYIGGFIQPEYIERIGQRFNMQGFMMQIIYSLNKTNAKALIDLLWMNDQNSEFIIYSGFIYITLVNFITRILSFFFEEKIIDRIRYGLTLLVTLCFGINLLMIRQLIKPIICQLHLEKVERFSISVLIWILLSNGYVQSLGFIYPFIYSWFSIVNSNRNPFKLRLISAFIQSIFLNKVNLLSLLSFNLMKGVSTLFFTIQLLVSIFNGSFNITDNFSVPIIYGNCIGYGLFIYFILYYWIEKIWKAKAILQLLLFVFMLSKGLFHPLSSISFINVGQGDSILIKDAFNQHNVLIDTGKSSEYDRLDTYLKGMGIQTIDTLIITHGDSDHDGNQQVLIKDYDIQEVLMDDFDQYAVGNISITNINHDLSSDDINANSLVLVVELNGVTYFLPGDIPSNIEEKLLKNSNLKVDILKAAHHGSNTSSSELLLDTLQPKIIIYSAGKPSYYNHPSSQTIQKALKRHILQLNTYLDGDIQFISNRWMTLLITSNHHLMLLN